MICLTCRSSAGMSHPESWQPEQERHRNLLRAKGESTSLAQGGSARPALLDISKTEKQGGLKVVAAIPCYNEARFVEGVVSRVRKYVDLVLVIDDGSTDDTAALAEKAGALVMRHGVNRGKGVAMNTAFAKARELRVEALVLLDGDGQHDPDEVPLVLRPVLAGEADVAIGSRFLNGAKGIPFYRTVGQRTITLVANLGTGMKMTDTQCGFRAYSPKALDSLYFAQRHLGCVESEMQFLIKQKGLKAVEVPITAIYRERAKRNPVVQGLSTLWPTLRLAVHSRPALFLALASGGLLSLGLAAAAIAVLVRLVRGLS